MATGIPSATIGSRSGFRIEYDGKATEASVLETQPANLVCLTPWRNPEANRVLFGDNLPILASLLGDASVCGSVDLVYIDPPYATGSTFQSRTLDHAYEDRLSGALYIEFLRKRLILLRELLSEHGSIYVHLDDNMAMPVKVIMDEIFGARNFRNWITRKKCNPKNYTRKSYGKISDFLLFYSKTERYIWNPPFKDWDEAAILREYQYVDPNTGRRYKRVPLHAPGTRNGETGKPWRGKLPPPGKHWQYTPETLEALDRNGDIYWSPNGNPRRKVYFDRSPGTGVQDIWLEFKDAHNQNIQITGYPTEKNNDLLRRIVSSSSDAGGLVLDAFMGSGTTLAAADALGRRWVGIDNSPVALASTLSRLVNGTQPMGDYVSDKPSVPRHIPLFHELLPAFAIYAEQHRAVDAASIVSRYCNEEGELAS